MDDIKHGAEFSSFNFNSKYTFESFAAGKCNHAAVKAVRSTVKAPAYNCNPLYIYGPTGVGKTHLLHAAGNSLASLNANINVALFTCESFGGLLIEKIRAGNINDFIDLFKTVDYIMADDLHYLDSKDRTQEILSYAIKSFIESGKQVVLSSGCPPQGLASLNMGSFPKGLSIMINRLDMDTKRAILKMKLKEKQFVLSDKMQSYIIRNCNCGAFELEGILNRLIAISSLKRIPITSEVIVEACRPFSRAKKS